MKLTSNRPQQPLNLRIFEAAYPRPLCNSYPLLHRCVISNVSGNGHCRISIVRLEDTGECPEQFPFRKYHGQHRSIVWKLLTPGS